MSIGSPVPHTPPPPQTKGASSSVTHQGPFLCSLLQAPYPKGLRVTPHQMPYGLRLPHPVLASHLPLSYKLLQCSHCQVSAAIQGSSVAHPLHPISFCILSSSQVSLGTKETSVLRCRLHLVSKHKDRSVCGVSEGDWTGGRTRCQAPTSDFSPPGHLPE